MLFVGLISFLVYWIFVFYILKKWGFNNYKTISDHIATGEQRQFYNVPAMILISLFMLYVMLNLLPRYEMNPFAYFIALTAWIAELYVIHYPRYGQSYQRHDKLTRVVGSAILGLVAIVGFSSQASSAIRIFTGLSLCFAMIALLQIYKLKRKKYYIFFQISYFGGLQIVLLLLGAIS